MSLEPTNSHPRSNQTPMQKYFAPILLTLALYPLDRIQSVKQIQTTFNKQQLKTSKDISTICTHYGFTSWFRGLSPYFMRISGMYFLLHITDSIVGNAQEASRMYQESIGETIITKKDTNENLYYEGMKMGIISLGYSLIYPFQVIRMRMACQIEENRLYKNGGQCLKKIMKNEGKLIKTLYRGFNLSLIHFLCQYQFLSYCLGGLYDQNSRIKQYYPTILQSVSGLSQFLTAYLISETLLYPLDSMRKIIQINGAAGHENMFVKYLDLIKYHNKKSIYNGFHLRLFGGLAYYCVQAWASKQSSLQN